MFCICTILWRKVAKKGLISLIYSWFSFLIYVCLPFLFFWFSLCWHGCDGMLSIFPGVVSQLCEGLFLLGGWWKYQQSAVPAPRPPDNQHLPDHPAPQPQSHTWYCCRLVLHTHTHTPNLKMDNTTVRGANKRSGTGKHLRIWQVQSFAETSASHSHILISCCISLHHNF